MQARLTSEQGNYLGLQHCAPMIYPLGDVIESGYTISWQVAETDTSTAADVAGICNHDIQSWNNFRHRFLTNYLLQLFQMCRAMPPAPVQAHEQDIRRV